ncbi:MAG: hypothetical protein QXL14_03355 [Candidatus Aenigmatarchaeota archaeon]
MKDKSVKLLKTITIENIIIVKVMVYCLSIFFGTLFLALFCNSAELYLIGAIIYYTIGIFLYFDLRKYKQKGGEKNEQLYKTIVWGD